MQDCLEEKLSNTQIIFYLFYVFLIASWKSGTLQCTVMHLDLLSSSWTKQMSLCNELLMVWQLSQNTNVQMPYCLLCYVGNCVFQTLLLHIIPDQSWPRGKLCEFWDAEEKQLLYCEGYHWTQGCCQVPVCSCSSLLPDAGLAHPK